ncbi:MAG TPA: LuxR C-terminal-related transcriptional regulator [Bryobacteraceae bacterium]|nr:LuxR C-terminal-related transcriptional regulator [Bryobacteraceae bacterium]
MIRCPHCHREFIPDLSPVEQRLASMVAEGFPNKEIADEVGTSVQTVKNQLSKLCAKLGVPRYEYATRVKLAVWLNCELFQIGLKELGFVHEAA